MELYRLGTRQRPLYAWQPVCKCVNPNVAKVEDAGDARRQG
jgi:hypothetical protein